MASKVSNAQMKKIVDEYVIEQLKTVVGGLMKHTPKERKILLDSLQKGIVLLDQEMTQMGLIGTGSET